LVFRKRGFINLISGRKQRYGEATGETEGGGVCSVTVSAEGNAWSLERSARQDPP